ncbi:hypothetical protein CMI37_34945 [Candidatus Pacearchaeota archaeon]|nr:hypothetical protein [Candidatus Pacearchaeota archaeon]|tara:strand:+ start:3412 stop:3747 length:336 start_codon:yes stop_codon:yes gene_type:complete
MNSLAVVILIIVSSAILVGINLWLLWYTKLIYEISVRIFNVSERLLEETIVVKDETIIIRKDTRVIKNESTRVRELTETNTDLNRLNAAQKQNKKLTGKDRIVIPDEDAAG